MSRKLMFGLLMVALLVPAVASAQSAQVKKVWSDTSRLQAILLDASSDHEFSAAVWRTAGNEANMLANRIVGNTSGWRSESRQAALELRKHVREFRRAALAGNATEAKRHAREALDPAATLMGRIAASM